MKKLLLVLLLLASLHNVEAKNIKYYIEKGIPNIVIGLNSNIDGLVESCIYQSIMLKSKYPDIDYNKVIAQLKELSINGKTVKIRYTAHLAYTYLKDYPQFEQVELKNNAMPEENFKVLISQIEKLASR